MDSLKSDVLSVINKADTDYKASVAVSSRFVHFLNWLKEDCTIDADENLWKYEGISTNYYMDSEKAYQYWLTNILKNG